MRTNILLIFILLAAAFLSSCGITPPGGFQPPPVVMLWDKPATEDEPGENARPAGLSLFHNDGSIDEFDFGPQWSKDAFINTRSGVAAFVGGDGSISLDESLRCYDIVTGEMLFNIEGNWVPLGFIEDGWALVAMQVETRWRIIHGARSEVKRPNFTERGYSLKYTLHIIDVLSGETAKTLVVYDVKSKQTRWEDRVDFKPVLASDAGLLFAALPEFPYKTEELTEEMRPVRLWALDIRSEDATAIDIDDYIRDTGFSYVTSSDGRTVAFQSQVEGETVALKMPYYGDAAREWGSLYEWRDGETTRIAELEEGRVRQQIGICRRGDILLCAEIEYDDETRYPVEGTLKFFLEDLSSPNRIDLDIEGDVWNISLSPGGRWVSYMVNSGDWLEAHLLDTVRGEDERLAQCGPRTRFYGFAGTERGDIAIPALNAMMFGIRATTPPGARNESALL